MRIYSTVLAALLSIPAIAFAADDADLRALRDEVAQLRAAYEKRISDLENRLVQAEAKATSAESAAVFNWWRRASTTAEPVRSGLCAPSSLT